MTSIEQEDIKEIKEAKKICSGFGECFSDCNCSCFDIFTDIYFPECECGHRRHYGLCPDKQMICKYDCKRYRCILFRKCKTEIPLYLANIYEGYCRHCAQRMEDLKETKEELKCPICFEMKRLIYLNCGHKVCKYCWGVISYPPDPEDIYLCLINREKLQYPRCPICRAESKELKSTQFLNMTPSDEPPDSGI